MRKYSSYILFMLITLLVVVVALNGIGPLDGLQRSLNDLLCSVTASGDARPNIVVVKIDPKTMKDFGQWPWNYDMVGDLIAACGHGEPKTVALDFLISEQYAQDSAGYTDILADQIGWVKNVVIPYDIALTTFRDNRTNNPKYLFDYSVSVDNPLGLMAEEASLQVRKIFLPSTKILESKPILGFDYIMPDDDRVLRHHALLMNYEGYYYPSLPLLAASHYLGVSPDQIKVLENQFIELGKDRKIPLEEQSQFFVTFPKENTILEVSAADILTEKFDIKRLKNKFVLLAVEEVSASQIATPVNAQTPKSFITAAIIENIINDNLTRVQKHNAGINLLFIFLIGALFAFIMPQVNNMYRFIILGGSLFILINVAYITYSQFNLLFNTVYLALEVLLFMVAAPLLDSELLGAKSEAEKKNKIKDINRDAAKIDPVALKEAPVKELKNLPSDTSNIKTTAFQTLSEPEKTSAFATADHQEISSFDHQTIDIDDSDDTKTSAFNPEEHEPVIITPEEFEEELSDDMLFEDAFNDSDSGKLSDSDRLDTDPSDSGPIRKLGRYQISGTLGKGAMGHVYKGVDPAINRPVALKTIRLDFVNDPEEMEELKERLYREAQAAGKLSHPNIVTIYDVGSEGQLQYIAMEYLEGRTLEDMIKKKVNFNYKIIAKIIIQICNALEYAHDKGIVHRDIKPANIMITQDYTVKLMDYGIARIDSNSMTKTGIAMGTPNYISPEQLKGQTVDKRADIFSLGVVIYELLLGRRPFKGENITSLIYSIINNEPDKPSNLNPQIPLLFDRIIEKALQKDPAARYQRAADIIHDLNDFVDSFAIK